MFLLFSLILLALCSFSSVADADTCGTAGSTAVLTVAVTVLVASRSPFVGAAVAVVVACFDLDASKFISWPTAFAASGFRNGMLSTLGGPGGVSVFSLFSTLIPPIGTPLYYLLTAAVLFISSSSVDDSSVSVSTILLPFPVSRFLICVKAPGMFLLRFLRWWSLGRGPSELNRTELSRDGRVTAGDGRPGPMGVVSMTSHGEPSALLKLTVRGFRLDHCLLCSSVQSLKVPLTSCSSGEGALASLSLVHTRSSSVVLRRCL